MLSSLTYNQSGVLRSWDRVEVHLSVCVLIPVAGDNKLSDFICGISGPD